MHRGAQAPTPGAIALASRCAVLMGAEGTCGSVPQSLCPAAIALASLRTPWFGLSRLLRASTVTMPPPTSAFQHGADSENWRGLMVISKATSWLLWRHLMRGGPV